MVAEEHRPISKRTRDARATAKTRVNSRTADIASIIQDLLAKGADSLRAIADGLNEAGIRTARGRGKWSAVQVQRVLKRI